MNERERLFWERARIYDASARVEWIDATMYDAPEKVDSYDTVKDPENVSTFNSAAELEFLDMIDHFESRSVIDLGCGAGAFFHLLSSVSPHVRYHGLDLSGEQIARARHNFEACFEVRDIATIEQSEFAQYDAVHAYSVFVFMPVARQLETIGRILGSGARTIIETSVTVADPEFAPRSCFRDFNGDRDDGRSLMTTISFPFRHEIERVVAPSDHKIEFSEGAYGSTRAINNSDRAGGALADKSSIKARNREYEADHPLPRRWKLLTARIKPKNWTPPRDYSRMKAPEIRARILSFLVGGA